MCFLIIEITITCSTQVKNYTCMQKNVEQAGYTCINQIVKQAGILIEDAIYLN
jgi:hypothetical protein